MQFMERNCSNECGWNEEPGWFSIREYVTTNLEVKGRQKDTQFLVTALGMQKVVLGYPWLVEANPKINWREQKFSWWEETPKVNI